MIVRIDGTRISDKVARHSSAICAETGIRTSTCVCDPDYCGLYEDCLRKDRDDADDFDELWDEAE